MQGETRTSAEMSHDGQNRVEASREREYLQPTDEKSDEKGIGEAQKVSLATSPRLRFFAMIINVLVVGELFVAMFFAARTPDSLTPVFFKVFFSLLVPTLIVAFLGRRWIAKAEQ